jgi:hypothetical protein
MAIQQSLNTCYQHLAVNCADYLVILLGCAGGGIFGVIMTLFIMATLTMLSSSGVFNLYYGGMLVSLGVILVSGIYRRRKKIELDSE